ncbi:vWA domain-containing protein [Frigoriglobus tundricola]|uniref:Aerotolerance protein BatA n=1 Tax=Frigoriglobus tundricola TaxID=2774151 RepID=A0A6M5YP54_9BACT|nr:VWA domain-containing protein [Frigoriglobus tundricola]QJW95857.1 Aerotolerance protein BatA [Frigoriglobus tundricola]
MLWSITFANPEFLWLAPLPVALALWWARRRRPAIRFSDVTRFAGRAGPRAVLAARGGAVLRGLACLALVLACAGPRRPDERTRLPADGIAIMMAIDISGSMDTPDVAWAVGGPPVARLEAARRAFKLFVGGGEAPDGSAFQPRPGDAIGLVAFAAVPQTQCPLTLNHSVLFKVVDALQARGGADAGTNIGDALAEGVERLDAVRVRKTKVLILLSDGEHNVVKEDAPDAKRPGIDRTMKPREAAQLAANLGVRVYTIDTGGDPPVGAAPDAVQQRLEGREVLKRVAEMTGGRSFAATSGAELLAAYREIGALEKIVTPAPIYRRYFEYYAWCAGAALVLVLTAHALDRTLWRVVT